MVYFAGVEVLDGMFGMCSRWILVVSAAQEAPDRPKSLPDRDETVNDA
jgi:hypothetical protein